MKPNDTTRGTVALLCRDVTYIVPYSEEDKLLLRRIKTLEIPGFRYPIKLVPFAFQSTRYGRLETLNDCTPRSHKTHKTTSTKRYFEPLGRK